MNIPYRTQRKLKRVGLVLLILAMLSVIVWFCSVIFLERYIVYTKDGAYLDFSISPQQMMGEVAQPPVGKENVSIYFNEGADSLNSNAVLTKLDGYYIDSEALTKDSAGIWEQIKILPQGTPVMIELKPGRGTFYYKSTLTDATPAQTVSVDAVDELVKELNKKGFYTIAQISAFRDYTYGLSHVSAGIPVAGKQFLWMDPGGCYWLKPDDPGVQAWIISIVKELKTMGFNEVVLSNFSYPDTDKATIPENKDEILAQTAEKLLTELGGDTFTLSFGVKDSTFKLPEGRCRMYLENISAQAVGSQMDQAKLPDPSVRLVFVAKTNDTRYEQSSVLRPIGAAQVLEAQKADRASAKDLAVKRKAEKEAAERENSQQAAAASPAGETTVSTTSVETTAEP